MAARKSVATKIQAEAQAIDDRRQKQIANQVEIIDRLLDGATYDDVLQHLNETLSDTQVRLAEAEAEISRLRAEQAGA